MTAAIEVRGLEKSSGKTHILGSPYTIARINRVDAEEIIETTRTPAALSKMPAPAHR